LNTAKRSREFDVDFDPLERVLEGEYAKRPGLLEEPVRDPQVTGVIRRTAFLRALELIV